MLPYLIPFLFTLLCSIKFDNNKKWNIYARVCYFFLFIYLTLLIGLRYKIGGDSLQYEEAYEVAKKLSSWQFDLSSAWQPGYTFFEAVVKSYSDKFFVFQLFHAFAVNVCLFIFIKKNTKNRFTALLLIEYMIYLYFMTEVLREVLAVMVFVLIYPYYKEKKWVKYILGVLFAAMFHFSALALLMLPFLRFLKFDYKYIFFIVGAIAATPIMLKIFGIFNIEGITDEVQSAWAASSVGMSLSLASFAKGAIFPLIFAYFVKYKTSFQLKFENLISIMILFGVLSFSSPMLFGRTLNYFYLFLALSFADYLVCAFKCHRTFSLSNARIFIIFFLLIYLTSYLVLGGWYRFWIPYRSVL